MKLTMTTFLTLDGVYQAPGGPGEDPSGGFEHEGWLVPYADEDMGRFVVEWFSAADAFLLGRRTYEIFAAHWPKVTDDSDPVASKLNALPKYVASRTLNEVEWNNATLIDGNVVDALGMLKDEPGDELQIHGSGDLAQTLMRHDLIDEYRLWVYPVVLGSGKRLFEEGNLPAALELVDTKTTSTGVVIQVYRPAGKPVYGSFAVDEHGATEAIAAVGHELRAGPQG